MADFIVQNVGAIIGVGGVTALALYSCVAKLRVPPPQTREAAEALARQLIEEEEKKSGRKGARSATASAGVARELAREARRRKREANSEWSQASGTDGEHGLIGGTSASEGESARPAKPLPAPKPVPPVQQRQLTSGPPESDDSDLLLLANLTKASKPAATAPAVPPKAAVSSPVAAPKKTVQEESTASSAVRKPPASPTRNVPASLPPPAAAAPVTVSRALPASSVPAPASAQPEPSAKSKPAEAAKTSTKPSARTRTPSPTKPHSAPKISPQRELIESSPAANPALAEAEATVASLKAQLSASNASNAALRESYSVLRDSNTTIQSALSEALSTSSEARTELEQAKTEATKAKQEAEKLAKEAHLWRERAERARDDGEKAKREKEEWEGRAKVKGAEVQQASQQANLALARLQEVTTAHAASGTTIALLTTQNVHLSAQLSQSASENNHLRSLVDSLGAQAEALKRDHEALREVAQGYERSAREADGSLDVERKAREDAEAKARELEAALDAATEEAKVARETASSAKSSGPALEAVAETERLLAETKARVVELEWELGEETSAKQRGFVEAEGLRKMPLVAEDKVREVEAAAEAKAKAAPVKVEVEHKVDAQLAERLRAASEGREAASRYLAQVAEELQTSKDSIASLQKKLTQVESERNALQSAPRTLPAALPASHAAPSAIVDTDLSSALEDARRAAQVAQTRAIEAEEKLRLERAKHAVKADVPKKEDVRAAAEEIVKGQKELAVAVEKLTARKDVEGVPSTKGVSLDSENLAKLRAQESTTARYLEHVLEELAATKRKVVAVQAQKLKEVQSVTEAAVVAAEPKDTKQGEELLKKYAELQNELARRNDAATEHARYLATVVGAVEGRLSALASSASSASRSGSPSRKVASNTTATTPVTSVSTSTATSPVRTSNKMSAAHPDVADVASGDAEVVVGVEVGTGPAGGRGDGTLTPDSIEGEVV